MNKEDRKTFTKIIFDFLHNDNQKNEDITYKDIPFLQVFISANPDILQNNTTMSDIQSLIDSIKTKFVKERNINNIDNYIVDMSSNENFTISDLERKSDKIFYTINKSSFVDNDMEILIQDRKAKYINDQINSFIKDKKKLPKYTDLKSINLSKFFDNNKIYIIFLLKFIDNFITKTTKSAPKMKTLFKELFINNKKLFTDFMLLNIQNITDDKFQEIGSKIKPLIIDIENELLKSVEGSQYSYGSSSISEKLYNFIKIFFPKFDFIGVKITKKSI